MDLKFAFEYFIIYIFPIAITVFGLGGNALGLILCSSIKMDDTLAIRIYEYVLYYSWLES